MSNNELKGDALVAEAEKKMSGGVGTEKGTAIEAAELYEAAAVHYKLDKKCTPFVFKENPLAGTPPPT
jgi:hypothetical protein